MKTFQVLAMVIGGIVGAYVGYWIGYAAGWGEGADWPFVIGGGEGAIALSIALSIVGVLFAGWLTGDHGSSAPRGV